MSDEREDIKAVVERVRKSYLANPVGAPFDNTDIRRLCDELDPPEPTLPDVRLMVGTPSPEAGKSIFIVCDEVMYRWNTDRNAAIKCAYDVKDVPDIRPLHADADERPCGVCGKRAEDMLSEDTCAACEADELRNATAN